MSAICLVSSQAGYFGSGSEDRPQWRERDDPWQLYDPSAIAERQARADSEEDD